MRSVFPEARDLFARSLTLYRAAEDRPGIAMTLSNLGWQVLNTGDLAAGEAMSMEAMTMHQGLGDELGVALSLNNLAWIAMERGEFELAERRFGDAIASHQRLGDHRAAAFVMSFLGLLVARRGDLAAPSHCRSRRSRRVARSRTEATRSRASSGSRSPATCVAIPATMRELSRSSICPLSVKLGRLWPIAYGSTELGAMLLDHGELERGAFGARRGARGASPNWGRPGRGKRTVAAQRRSPSPGQG